MTIQELGRITKEKYPQYQTLSDVEVGQKVLAKYPVYQSQIQTESKPEPQPEKEKSTAKKVTGAVGSFFKGAYKGAAKTVANIGTGGQKVLDTITKPIAETVTGKPYVPTETLNEALGDRLKPKGTAESIGYGAEQIGEFFIPAGAAGKVGKAVEATGAASKLVKTSKIGTEAASIAGITKAQGGTNENVGENLIGAGIAGAAGKVIGKVADKLAPRVINSLIKPASKDFEFGRNPGLGIVREKISANSFEDLLKKIKVKRTEVGDEIGKLLSHPEVSKETIDIIKALKPIDEALEKATRTGDQSLVDGLLDFHSGLTNEFARVEGKLVSIGTKPLKVSPQDALQYKIDIGDSVRWREGIDNDLNKIKTKVYRNVRDLMEEAVGNARTRNKNIPNIRDLNERFANLTTAETAARQRAGVTKRLNLSTLGGTVTGAVVNAPAIAEHVKEGDIEGLAKDLLTVGAFGLGGKALGSVALKTRAAKAIAAFSPEQRALLSQAIPLIRNVFLSQNSQSQEQ